MIDKICKCIDKDKTMERLIKPVEYAQEMGISRQAVYAKIKRGILQSKSVDGKLYIVMDKESQLPDESQSIEKVSDNKHNTVVAEVNGEQRKEPDYEMLLRAKDETISVLKGTVKDLKKSNKQMTTTLRGEIDLLKEAFHEMRSMYVTQIEHIRQPVFPPSQKPIEVAAVESHKEKWISLKKFFKIHEIINIKEQKKMVKKLKKAYKKGDKRILDKEGVIKLNERENFKDIVS